MLQKYLDIQFYFLLFFFSDEENDAKLWTDIVESIKSWQQSKVIKIQQRNRGLHRSVLQEILFQKLSFFHQLTQNNTVENTYL